MTKQEIETMNKLEGEIEDKREQLKPFKRKIEQIRYQQEKNKELKQNYLQQTLLNNNKIKDELSNAIVQSKNHLLLDIENLKKSTGDHTEIMDEIEDISGSYNEYIDELQNKLDVLDDVINEQSKIV